jgi:hypothetical protein
MPAGAFGFGRGRGGGVVGADAGEAQHRLRKTMRARAPGAAAGR